MTTPIESPAEQTRRTGPVARARANLEVLEILEILDQLRDRGQPATEEQQAIIRQWSGWGPMANAFEPNRTGTWAEIGARIEWLLRPNELIEARKATYSAFYTPPEISRASWQILQGLGFDRGRILEPGCGSGVFMDNTPPEIRSDVRWLGVERDPTTAAVAVALHPDAQIITGKLQQATLPVLSVDAVLGNVPFADTLIYDPSAPEAVRANLHNYFLWRSIQTLRPGGIAVLITSRYTLDSKGASARQQLFADADLLGAIRLPSSAWLSGGTTVTADILVLRRRRGDEDVRIHDRRWLDAVDVPAFDTSVNRLFVDQPDLVIGTMRANRGNKYGQTLVVDFTPNDDTPTWQDGLEAAVASIVAVQPDQQHRAWRVDAPVGVLSADNTILTDAEGRKEGSFHIINTRAMVVIDGRLDPVRTRRKLKDPGVYEYVEPTEEQLAAASFAQEGGQLVVDGQTAPLLIRRNAKASSSVDSADDIDEAAAGGRTDQAATAGTPIENTPAEEYEQIPLTETHLARLTFVEGSPMLRVDGRLEPVLIRRNVKASSSVDSADDTDEAAAGRRTDQAATAGTPIEDTPPDEYEYVDLKGKQLAELTALVGLRDVTLAVKDLELRAVEQERIAQRAQRQILMAQRQQAATSQSTVALTAAILNVPPGQQPAAVSAAVRIAAVTAFTAAATTLEQAAEQERQAIEQRDAATAQVAAFDAQLDGLRAELNTCYDDYCARYGYLNRVTITTGKPDEETGLPTQTKRRPQIMYRFRRDPDYVDVLALEDWNHDSQTAEKHAIFTTRVNRVAEPVTRAESAADAIALCLDAHNRLDLPTIAALLDITVEHVPEALGELAYLDPTTDEWTERGEYLSGNVRAKLEQAEQAATDDPQQFTRNVEALRARQPRDLGPGEIFGQLGAAWIPKDDVARFIRELLNPRGLIAVRREPLTSRWSLILGNKSDRTRPEASSEWGTEAKDAYSLIETELNGGVTLVTTEIKEADGTKQRVTDREATAQARAKQKQIAARFSEWLWEDPDRADRLAETYNRTFNATVLREYDGSHLTVPGLAADFVPYQSQLDMVFRAISNKSALCGHDVGGGKTTIMAMTAVKLRQLGLATKPMIVVLKSTLEDIAREIKQRVPTANLLVADEFSMSDARSRALWAKRCATGDYDAVIITHPAFTKISMHEHFQADYLAELAATYRASLTAAMGSIDADDNESGVSDRHVKQVEKLIDSLEARAQYLLDHASDKDIYFEHLGVDYLLVDEFHYFKNLQVPCHTEGFSMSASKRATDLHMKLSWLRSQRDRVATFFSGTPVSNSMLELFVVQEYLMPERLEELDLSSPDAWARWCVQFEENQEISPDGQTIRLKLRPTRFKNVYELLMLLAERADIRSQQQLGLVLPPHERETIVVPRSRVQEAQSGQLVARAEAVKGQPPVKGADNILTVVMDGRKGAADPELVELFDPAAVKFDRAIDEIATTYHRLKDLQFPADAKHEADTVTGARGAFQLAFLDLGTPGEKNKKKGKNTVNVHTGQLYGKIREGLVAEGVPRDRIRFIHEAHTDQQRVQLFRDCREGRVSVLIASTEKGGVGVNVQDRLVRIHHIDAPWRPSDIKQRDGRGIRPGNRMKAMADLVLEMKAQGEPVPEYWPLAVMKTIYVTKETFDAFMWQKLEYKEQFISQLFGGRLDPSLREIEDIGAVGLDAAEIKALASGNTLLMDLAKAEQKFKSLKDLAAGHTRAQKRLSNDIRRYESLAEAEDVQAAALEAVAVAGQDRDPNQLGFLTSSGVPIAEDALDGVLAWVGEQALTARNQARAARSAAEVARYVEPVGRADDVLIWHSMGLTFEVKAQGWRHDVLHAIVRPKGLYSSVNQYRLELGLHCLNKGQHHRIRKAVQVLLTTAAEQAAQLRAASADLRDRAEAARRQVGKPFPQQAELDTTRTDLQRIRQEIAAVAQEAEPDAAAKMQQRAEENVAIFELAKAAYHDERLRPRLIDYLHSVSAPGEMVQAPPRPRLPTNVVAGPAVTPSDAHQNASASGSHAMTDGPQDTTLGEPGGSFSLPRGTVLSEERAPDRSSRVWTGQHHAGVDIRVSCYHDASAPESAARWSYQLSRRSGTKANLLVGDRWIPAEEWASVDELIGHLDQHVGAYTIWRSVLDDEIDWAQQAGLSLRRVAEQRRDRGDGPLLADDDGELIAASQDDAAHHLVQMAKSGDSGILTWRGVECRISTVPVNESNPNWVTGLVLSVGGGFRVPLPTPWTMEGDRRIPALIDYVVDHAEDIAADQDRYLAELRTLVAEPTRPVDRLPTPPHEKPLEAVERQARSATGRPSQAGTRRQSATSRSAARGKRSTRTSSKPEPVSPPGPASRSDGPPATEDGQNDGTTPPTVEPAMPAGLDTVEITDETTDHEATTQPRNADAAPASPTRAEAVSPELQGELRAVHAEMLAELAAASYTQQQQAGIGSAGAVDHDNRTVTTDANSALPDAMTALVDLVDAVRTHRHQLAANTRDLLSAAQQKGLSGSAWQQAGDRLARADELDALARRTATARRDEQSFLIPRERGVMARLLNEGDLAPTLLGFARAAQQGVSPDTVLSGLIPADHLTWRGMTVWFETGDQGVQIQLACTQDGGFDTIPVPEEWLHHVEGGQLLRDAIIGAVASAGRRADELRTEAASALRAAQDGQAQDRGRPSSQAPVDTTAPSDPDIAESSTSTQDTVTAVAPTSVPEPVSAQQPETQTGQEDHQSGNAPVQRGPEGMDTPRDAATGPSLDLPALRELRALAAEHDLRVRVVPVGTARFITVHEPEAVRPPVLCWPFGSTEAFDGAGRPMPVKATAEYVARYRAAIAPELFTAQTGLRDWPRRLAQLTPHMVPGPEYRASIRRHVDEALNLVGSNDVEAENLLCRAENIAGPLILTPEREAQVVREIEHRAAGYAWTGDVGRYLVESAHLDGSWQEWDWITAYVREHPDVLDRRPVDQASAARDAADHGDMQRVAQAASKQARAAFEAGDFDAALDLLDRAEIFDPDNLPKWTRARDVVAHGKPHDVAESAAERDATSSGQPAGIPAGEDAGLATAAAAEADPALIIPDHKIATYARINAEAALWFEQQLDASTVAQEYLARSDRLRSHGNVDRIRELGFSIGYVPTGWTGLVKHLRGKGFSDQDMIDAGVASISSRNELIDRFRDRITFGIRDSEGRMAGFICRALSDDAPAKYLNSATSSLFAKGELLFGLYEQRALAGRAVPVVVEGPFDVVAILVSMGSDRPLMPVAPCGTALTAEHLDALDALVPVDQRHVFALDGDDAGLKAMLRRAEEAIRRYPNPYITTLPDGLDPAKWAERVDATEQIAAYLGPPHSRPAIEVLVDAHMALWQDQLEDPEGRVGAAWEAAALMATVDPHRIADLAVTVATRLRIEPEYMIQYVVEARLPVWVDQVDSDGGRVEVAWEAAALMAAVDPHRIADVALHVATRFGIEPERLAEYIAEVRHERDKQRQSGPINDSATAEPQEAADVVLPVLQPHQPDQVTDIGEAVESPPSHDPQETVGAAPPVGERPATLDGQQAQPARGISTGSADSSAPATKQSENDAHGTDQASVGPWTRRIQITLVGKSAVVSGTDGGDPTVLRQTLKEKGFLWRPQEGKVWKHLLPRKCPRDAAVRAIQDVLAELDAKEAAKTAPAPTFPPTPQQQAIIDAFREGQNVAVRALAGTGKTSTLRMIAALVPDRKITYIAFNRSIADEAQAAFGRNVLADTMHAVARRALSNDARYQKKLGEVAKNDGFPPEIAPILGLTTDEPVAFGQRGEQQIEAVSLVRMAMGVVKRFRESADKQISTRHLPSDVTQNPHGLGTLVLQCAEEIWADKTSPTGVLKFTHDDYLKIWALGDPTIPGDVIFFDEAQDVNELQAKLVQAQSAQTVVVGDTYQSIYGFRGARDFLTGWPAEVTLPLTQSWRFGPLVADLGNRFLALLRSTLVLEGNPGLDSRLDVVADPDAVLCRTNAAAVAAVITGKEDGKRVALVGGGNDIKDIARAAKDLKRGRRTRHPELSAFGSWWDVVEYVNQHEDAQSLRAFVRLVDKYGPDGLITMADELVDERETDPQLTPQLVVSTAHKAKGREWDSVVIADDFKPPTVDEETGETQLPLPEELRLAYVTVTRAKKRLQLGSLEWILGYGEPVPSTTASEPSAERRADPVQDAEQATVPETTAAHGDHPHPDMPVIAPQPVPGMATSADESQAGLHGWAEPGPEPGVWRVAASPTAAAAREAARTHAERREVRLRTDDATWVFADTSEAVQPAAAGSEPPTVIEPDLPSVPGHEAAVEDNRTDEPAVELDLANDDGAQPPAHVPETSTRLVAPAANGLVTVEDLSDAEQPSPQWTGSQFPIQLRMENLTSRDVFQQWISDGLRDLPREIDGTPTGPVHLALAVAGSAIRNGAVFPAEATAWRVVGNDASPLDTAHRLRQLADLIDIAVPDTDTQRDVLGAYYQDRHLAVHLRAICQQIEQIAGHPVHLGRARAAALFRTLNPQAIRAAHRAVASGATDAVTEFFGTNLPPPLRGRLIDPAALQVLRDAVTAHTTGAGFDPGLRGQQEVEHGAAQETAIVLHCLAGEARRRARQSDSGGQALREVGIDAVAGMLDAVAGHMATAGGFAVPEELTATVVDAAAERNEVTEQRTSGSEPLRDSDIAAVLRAMPGDDFAQLVRDANSRRPAISRDGESWRTRTADEPDAGMLELVTRSQRGIEIEIDIPGRPRQGELTWRELQNWIDPELSPAARRVLLAADAAQRDFVDAEQGFIPIGEHQLWREACQELMGYRDDAVAAIVDAALAAHQTGTARRRRRRSAGSQAEAPMSLDHHDADLPEPTRAVLDRIIVLTAVLSSDQVQHKPLASVAAGERDPQEPRAPRPKSLQGLITPGGTSDSAPADNTAEQPVPEPGSIPPFAAPRDVTPADLGWHRSQIQYGEDGPQERWRRGECEIVLNWLSTEDDLLLTAPMLVDGRPYVLESVEDFRTVLAEAGMHGVARHSGTRWIATPTPTAAVARTLVRNDHALRLVTLDPQRGWIFANSRDPIALATAPNTPDQQPKPTQEVEQFSLWDSTDASTTDTAVNVVAPVAADLTPFGANRELGDGENRPTSGAGDDPQQLARPMSGVVDPDEADPAQPSPDPFQPPTERRSEPAVALSLNDGRPLDHVPDAREGAQRYFGGAIEAFIREEPGRFRLIVGRHPSEASTGRATRPWWWSVDRIDDAGNELPAAVTPSRTTYHTAQDALRAASVELAKLEPRLRVIAMEEVGHAQPLTALPLTNTDVALALQTLEPWQFAGFVRQMVSGRVPSLGVGGSSRVPGMVVERSARAINVRVRSASQPRAGEMSSTQLANWVRAGLTPSLQNLLLDADTAHTRLREAKDRYLAIGEQHLAQWADDELSRLAAHAMGVIIGGAVEALGQMPPAEAPQRARQPINPADAEPVASLFDHDDDPSARTYGASIAQVRALTALLPASPTEPVTSLAAFAGISATSSPAQSPGPDTTAGGETPATTREPAQNAPPPVAEAPAPGPVVPGTGEPPDTEQTSNQRAFERPPLAIQVVTLVPAGAGGAPPLVDQLSVATLPEAVRHDEPARLAVVTAGRALREPATDPTIRAEMVVNLGAGRSGEAAATAEQMDALARMVEAAGYDEVMSGGSLPLGEYLRATSTEIRRLLGINTASAIFAEQATQADLPAVTDAQQELTTEDPVAHTSEPPLVPGMTWSQLEQAARGLGFTVVKTRSAREVRTDANLQTITVPWDSDGVRSTDLLFDELARMTGATEPTQAQVTGQESNAGSEPPAEPDTTNEPQPRQSTDPEPDLSAATAHKVTQHSDPHPLLLPMRGQALAPDTTPAAQSAVASHEGAPDGTGAVEEAPPMDQTLALDLESGSEQDTHELGDTLVDQENIDESDMDRTGLDGDDGLPEEWDRVASAADLWEDEANHDTALVPDVAGSDVDESDPDDHSETVVEEAIPTPRRETGRQPRPADEHDRADQIPGTSVTGATAPVVRPHDGDATDQTDASDAIAEQWSRLVAQAAVLGYAVQTRWVGESSIQPDTGTIHISLDQSAYARLGDLALLLVEAAHRRTPIDVIPSNLLPRQRSEEAEFAPHSGTLERELVEMMRPAPSTGRFTGQLDPPAEQPAAGDTQQPPATDTPLYDVLRRELGVLEEIAPSERAVADAPPRRERTVLSGLSSGRNAERPVTNTRGEARTSAEVTGARGRHR